MEPERWQRIREIFPVALALAPDERSARLAEACEDAGLRAEVESLLAAHQAAAGFLSGPGEDAPEQTSVAGQRIGPYQLVERLGAGGMGVVFLALRADGEFERRVALKVLKPGLDSEEVIRRFRTERQILAALEHPNIARLLDGGTTERGLPYLVMEYVEGETIDAYCEKRQLSLRQRLELFLAVCAAVEQAHRHLVVHRDLKPANVLVTSEGTPKLLDFGIAKLLDPELSVLALGATSLGLQPMTPEYASPEQVRGELVTTASDVYSLGVLLYELLAGRHPYRSQASTPSEMLRLVTEEEPLRPSLAATEGGERLSRQLAGDLDNIVLKALRKEPGRRYSSVEQLADEVRRYLAGRPVLARPGTLGYRTSKFLRRHRVGAAVAATLLLALLGFGIAMAALAARLAQERDHAEQQRRRAEQVTAFLTEIFEVSDPWKSSGQTVTARELLDQGARKISTRLAGEPAVQADLMRTVGTIYRKLSLFDRADPLLAGALERRRQLFGNADLKVAESLGDLGLLAEERGDYAAAEDFYRRSLSLRRKLLGPEHADVAQSLSDLAGILWATGRHAEAEQAFRDVLAQRRRLFGSEHLEVAKSLNNLGIVLWARGRYAEAEGLQREALSLRRKLSGPGSLDVADSLNNLALVVQSRGGLREAESLYREALAIWTRRLGRHPRVAAGLNNVGRLLQAQGRFGEAERFHREALALRREILGDGHFETTQSLENLSVVTRGQDRYSEAEAWARQTLRLRRRLFGSEHPAIADAEQSLALALQGEGKAADAESLLRSVLALRRKLLGEGHPQVAAAFVDLASILQSRGNAAGGEAAARQALKILGQAQTVSRIAIAEAESVLGACLAAEHRFVEAEPFLTRSLAVLVAESGEMAPETRHARERLDAFHRMSITSQLHSR